jgi:PBP1b-binding outer membrane lipoprotein LpoB
MQRINFGIISSLLLATLLLSSCSSFYKEPEIKIVTKLEKTVVPIVPMPKPVQMNDIRIYVVSPNENFEEFKKEFEAKNGADAYIAISIKDYENLSNNFAELRRYIEQQKAIIVYYEEAVSPLPEDNKSE